MNTHLLPKIFVQWTSRDALCLFIWGLLLPYSTLSSAMDSQGMWTLAWEDEPPKNVPAHSARVEMGLNMEVEIPHPSPGSATCFCNMRIYRFIKLLTFRSIFAFASCIHFRLVSRMLSIVACFVLRLATSGHHICSRSAVIHWGVAIGKKEPG